VVNVLAVSNKNEASLRGSADLSTGKTALVLLFNTVLTDHNLPNNDPRRLLAVPPASRCTTQRDHSEHALSR
jgi:hypothetical protein